MTIDEAVIFAAQELNAGGIPEPRREASLLLGFVLNKDRAFLISHNSDELSGEDLTRFLSFVERRSMGEPFHYIAGEKEFYGLLFYVDRSVLIPRPETEMLVERSVEFLREIDSPKFCEIGVGSGCIAISILNIIKTANAVCGDISEDALAVAEKNAERHLVADRAKFVRSDIFLDIPESDLDLIVSNPPYIPAADIAELETDVREFEPHTALTDGGSGFLILEMIIGQAPKHLRRGGKILLEFGIGQAEMVRGFFDAKIWSDVQIETDLRSIPRIVSAKLK